MNLVLIPAYNEAERIASVVLSVLPFADRVVVIDDASVDGTGEAASSAGAIVLTHAVNRGQGAALETGHAYARRLGANMVVHFDGDGQFDAVDIPKAIAFLQEKKADILFGTRYAAGREQKHIPWVKRRIIHPLAALFHRLFFGFSFSDAHNGFRVLSKKALQEISITQDRMAHATEIPALAVSRGLFLVEYPVTVRYYEMGQKPSSSFGIVVDLFFGWLSKK